MTFLSFSPSRWPHHCHTLRDFRSSLSNGHPSIRRTRWLCNFGLQLGRPSGRAMVQFANGHPAVVLDACSRKIVGLRRTICD